MNSCCFIGRLTRDPELRYTASTQTAICTFTLAVGRPGKDEADFPRIKVIGKAAENCEKHLKKGRLCGVTGHLQTGSFEKDGVKTFTSEYIADRVEFLEWGEKKSEDPIPSGFAEVDEDIPFA